ncbi:hypothetical protein [Psychrobacter fozii]|uniref:Uncharacterized protein n=1 Tax=Psychrobacter fozii TaxID=198480 RepID=A0A2V4VN07_9GAMM|nr:hypothetical protein [Psychrobacter fozii]PYE40285.1 hypothetical protein DFP82_102248 [Psychrobacter fozii]
MNRKLLILCVLIALIPSLFFIRSIYVMSDHHIQQCHWKSSGSKVMGDAFSFDNYIRLEGNVIYLGKQPTAQIMLRKYRPYADNIIIVSDIDYFELEIYYEKGCH